jgi:hypothetical protein
MSFRLADYSFMGRHPIDRMEQINNWPGLYAILCRRGSRHYLVDLGESDDLKTELEKDGRKPLWEENCSGNLIITVRYTKEMEQAERKQIEKKIRTRHKPLCRKRKKSAG